MRACNCSLAGTDACKYCQNNNTYDEGFYKYIEFQPTYIIPSPKDLNLFKSIDVYSTEELLDELSKRTNVFVKESYEDDNEKIYLVITKK